MEVYYNEIDSRAAAWLRELMVAGLIPSGVVDERSISDVRADDLRGFSQCHFFAGIGGWPYALRLAGWPADRPVWTGSCPCQPFSVAGKRKGTGDERHLWPVWFRLICECRPEVVFGEQVASSEVVGTELEAAFIDAVSRCDYAAANRIAKRLVSTGTVHYHARWIDGVFNDMEGIGYTCRTNDLPAPGVGAPHIRQRLYWVAHASNRDGRPGERREEMGTGSGGQRRRGSAIGGDACGLANSNNAGLEGWEQSELPECGGQRAVGTCIAPGWNGQCKWHHCLDGKSRRIPVEPALFPLANGLPGRVGLLRGAGNAIVPAVAAEFVKAFLTM